jgi:hypothetical protein
MTRWDEMEHSSGLSTGMGTSLGIPNHSLELYKNENGVRKKTSAQLEAASGHKKVGLKLMF